MALNPDFIVNSTPLGTYYNPFGPTLATLADGTALVAWVSQEGEASTDTEIRARWLKADGTPADADFIVNSTTQAFQWLPVATVTADGKVFLAWDSGDGADGDGTNLRGVVLDPLSQAPGPDLVINPPRASEGIYEGQNNQSEVALTALADGRVFALWSSYDGSDGDGLAIRGRFFSSDGTALGDDVLLNTTRIGSQYDPRAAALSNGRILITYASTDSEDGTPGSLRGRVLLADGTFQSADFLINSTPGGYQNEPDVTALGAGQALVVWFSSGPRMEDPEGGNPFFGPGEVRARLIGADGQPVGADFAVNSTALDFPYAKPAVTMLTDGRAFVVWHSGDGADGDWGTLRGRVIGADGQPIETDFVINTTPVNNQSSPAVAALADGRVLISWTSDDALTDGPVTRGIYITPDIGTAAADRITGTVVQDIQMGLGGNDRLYGRRGDDQLMGGGGRDVLNGGAGADALDGGTGRDVLKGGGGNDTLIGGNGRDTLKGGAGNDRLTGGTGADVFVFATQTGRDHVTDFGAGDTLQIDAGSWTGSAEQFVAEHAAVTGDGIVITLAEGSTILLAGLTQTDGLADVLQLI